MAARCTKTDVVLISSDSELSEESESPVRSKYDKWLEYICTVDSKLVVNKFIVLQVAVQL